jgi:hypothetical protein
MSGNDLAKFFTGFAANQVLTHSVLAIQGVQFSLFGISYTPSFNGAAAVIWTVVAFLLAYYAWWKEEGPAGIRPGARPGSAA